MPLAPDRRVALVTCAEIPDLDPDDQRVLGPLRARGVDVEIAVWDDPTVDWAAYDLAVLRCPWDYSLRHEEFLAWASGVPRLANPVDLVAWNIDKRYLIQVAAAGVPVIPTSWLSPGDTAFPGGTASRDGAAWTPPDDGEWVVKPAISAGSRNTGRYRMSVPAERDLVAVHVARLLAAGRVVLVQPYLSAVDDVGETGLVFFNGVFSHAIRKNAMLDGPDTGGGGLFRPELISARTASSVEIATAEAALRVVPTPAGRPPLYARVDLIPGSRGEPVVIEVEVTEPSLFLGWSEPAAGRFADAVAARL
jgi:hypothetical protein